MKVLVTGANGLIGKVTVRYLLERGYSVRAIDIAEETDLEDVEYAACDVREYTALQQQMRGCETVVHLAALPSPTHDIGPVTFDINVTGTFNVFEAAAQGGIKRICQASSVNAVGLTWTLNDFVPDCFPIDESQSAFVTDPYSLSKRMSEEIGDYYWRRDGISSTALRLPGVYPARFYKSEQYYEMRDKGRIFMNKFLQLSAGEQQRRLAAVREKVLAFRSARRLEYPIKESKPSPEEMEGISDGLWTAYMWYRHMLWTQVDVRDAAQAIEKSLTASFEGSHPLFINDTHNFLQYDVRVLAQIFYPDVTKWKEDLRDKEALISIKKAQALIGFEPNYSVQDA
jgi:NAD(P)-dependent dehydrogenase (short-subunit alcohol dehydrogenase family)